MRVYIPLFSTAIYTVFWLKTKLLIIRKLATIEVVSIGLCRILKYCSFMRFAFESHSNSTIKSHLFNSYSL